MTRSQLLGLIVLVAALPAIAACGGSSPTGGEAAPPAGEPAPAFAPDDVIVDVTEAPGFLPVSIAVDRRPSFRLYGDGTVVAAPPETRWTGGYPELTTYRLTPEGIDEVLAAAERNGLLAKAPDYGMPPVTDLGTTNVAFALAAGRFEHSAYALGFEDESGAVTAQQAGARERLSAFVEFVVGLGERAELLAAAPAPYDPEAVTVYAFPYEGDTTGIDVRDWTLADLGKSEEETTFGARCTTLTGSEPAALRRALEGAEPFTVWKSGGSLWTVGFDVVLPGGEGCGS